MIDTKQRILDTAERLFGDQGYAATSMRQIIAAAGVNLAAIHYHFGSKAELLDELIVRKAGPVNRRRMELLERCEIVAGDTPPPIGKVLAAFLRPMADAADQHPQFVRLMGRMISEGLMPGIVEKHFQPAVLRFVEVLRKGLPQLPAEELTWRIHFMVGAMAHTMCGGPAPVPVPESDFHTRIERLIAFLSAGFQAPASIVEAGAGTGIERT